jgi:hypothetical protein
MNATPDDPRLREITVTMTAQEWDSLGFAPEPTVGNLRGSDEERAAYHDDRKRQHELRSYASENRSLERRSQAKVASATQEGVEGRYALAKAEADALRPDVMTVIPQVREYARRMVDWYLHGDKTGVTHLGAGNGFDKVGKTGLTCWVIPGIPQMGFRLPQTKFSRSYPYFRFTEEEAAAIKAAVSEVCVLVDSWNDRSSGIGLKFDPKGER